MAAHLHYDVTLSSLVAAAYQSSTSNAYFALDPFASKPVGFSWAGGVSPIGAAQLEVKIDGALQDPNVSSPTWLHVLNVPVVTTASVAQMQFQGASLSHQPLLPYARVQVIAKNTGSGSLTVSNIVAKLIAEKLL